MTQNVSLCFNDFTNFGENSLDPNCKLTVSRNDNNKKFSDGYPVGV